MGGLAPRRTAPRDDAQVSHDLAISRPTYAWIVRPHQLGAMRASTIPPWFFMTLPIRCDAGVNDFATQQALPPNEAGRRASRILQLGAHHQALTTWAAHLVTSTGSTHRTESAHQTKVLNRTEWLHMAGDPSLSQHGPLIHERRRSCCSTPMHARLLRDSSSEAAETGESVARRRNQEAREIGQSTWLNTSCVC